MKAITRFAALALGAATLTCSAFGKTPEGWESDVEAAMQIAKKENKSVMLEFTGSDWCPPCQMMSKKVFSKVEFQEKASKNFVLVHLDFPEGDPELAKKNAPLAEKYKIEGFPTVVLLDSKGKEFHRFFASEYPDMEKFIGHLQDSIAKKELE